ncbi:MAG TPA: zincin-like metallopeptidase toxin domain-containing protein [Flavobacterium sp.]
MVGRNSGHLCSCSFVIFLLFRLRSSRHHTDCFGNYLYQGLVSIERLFAKSAQIINGFIKKAGNFADDIFKALDKLISLIKKEADHFASFIRQLLDDFFEWLKNLFKSGKADEVLKGKYNIKNFLGSEALTLEKLIEWENKIKIISANKCRFKLATANKRILKYIDEMDSLAFFDAGEIPPIIWYREGITEYIISHEYYHLEEFMKIGKKNFLKGINGSLEDILVNELLREKYVYKKILENSNKFSLNELKHAKEYYNQTLIKLVENGFELKPEYIIKLKK